jgi:hypothetical protein
MPNWCFNGLTVEGNPASVKQMMEQLNRPFEQMHDSWDIKTNTQEKKVTVYSNPVFAFHNIYSYIDHGVTQDEYLAQPPRNKEQSFADWFKHETNDWYNFNQREWGVKWDVAVSDEDQYPDTTMEDEENGENHVVYYKFNTPWSRPLPALERLSKQYPTLLFTLEYEEETGWGGEMEILNGVTISESEYSNICRQCDETDVLEYSVETGYETCTQCGYEN